MVEIKSIIDLKGCFTACATITNVGGSFYLNELLIFVFI
jgi:hypothetical protein